MNMELRRSKSTLSALRFPALNPRYSGMPRRYEETKPVVIQDFSHRKIIGIGHDIQGRLLDRLEREKTEAIDLAKSETWDEAEKKKHSAVRRTRDEAAVETAEALEQQKLEHEQRMKEEIIRVEMAMQKQAIEQVQAERARGERALAEAVKRTEERCARELEEAVAKARKEEQDIAAENIRKLTEKHNAFVADLRKSHATELAAKLSALRAEKDQERTDAVKAAHEHEQRVAKEQMEELRRRFEAMIALERSKIKSRNSEIEQLTRELEVMTLEKERLATFLHKTRRSFQDFIDRVQEVRKGEADFMLPPAYIDKIEKGLMEAI